MFILCVYIKGMFIKGEKWFGQNIGLRGSYRITGFLVCEARFPHWSWRVTMCQTHERMEIGKLWILKIKHKTTPSLGSPPQTILALFSRFPPWVCAHCTSSQGTGIKFWQVLHKEQFKVLGNFASVLISCWSNKLPTSSEGRFNFLAFLSF